MSFEFKTYLYIYKKKTFYFPSLSFNVNRIPFIVIYYFILFIFFTTKWSIEIYDSQYTVLDHLPKTPLGDSAFLVLARNDIIRLLPGVDYYPLRILELIIVKSPPYFFLFISHSGSKIIVILFSKTHSKP